MDSFCWFWQTNFFLQYLRLLSSFHAKVSNLKENRYFCPASLNSPLSLLLQQVGEVVTLVDEVGVLLLLVVQLHDGAAVAFLSQQQLLQHPSVRILLFVLQTVQLRAKRVNTHYGQQPAL